MEMKDYQQVYALWLACPGMGLNDLDDSPEGIRRFLQRNPETCFVAAEGETIAGCILVGTDGRRGYIYHTAVHPELQRRGLGRQLVERALESLRQMGIHKTALVLVGDFLGEEYERSLLYDPSFSHGFREAKKP